MALLGLLFATSALTAVSAATEECMDDPDFVSTFKGEELNCEDINSMTNEKKVKKICRKNKFKKSCLDTCGVCAKRERKTCPLEKPEDGTKCEDKKEGLTCDYDFTYTGGCGSDANILCMPVSALTCGDDKTWSLSTFTDTPCVGDIFPPSGQTCDPADCPLMEPEKNESCSDDFVGTSCGYDYQVTGCSPDDLTCSPSRIYTCKKKGKKRKWNLSVPEIDCGNSILKLNDTEPCDPKEFCPSLLPDFGSSCELSPDLSCPYEYTYIGCTFEDGVSCVPLTTAFCSDTNEWESLSVLFPPCLVLELDIPSGTCEPCPEEPPEKNCPLEKPTAGSECLIQADCSYDFETTGCTADDIQCTPTSYFFCLDGQWEEGGVATLQCPPPIGLPCPEKQPTDTECRSNGFAAGLKCEYDFRSVSCDEDSPSCQPGTFYFCTDDDGWQIAISDAFCLDYPPGFYDVCDPTDSEFCPLEAPENQTPCSNIGQNCDYGYSILGCTLEEATCSPSRFYECTQEGMWQLSLPSIPLCEEPDLVVPIFGPCDPDTFCPLVKPSNQSCSNVGLECGYDFTNVSCDEDSPNCQPGTFYYCTDDYAWQIEKTYSLCEDQDYPPGFGAVCDPTDSEFCPLEAPENQTPCSNIGQYCDYGYWILGCTLEEATCSPTSFYECTQEGMWQLSLPSPNLCEEPDPNVPIFGGPCDPDTFCPLVKPSNQSCSNVGLECDYDFTNVSCDKEEEICQPLSHYLCIEDFGPDGNVWSLAISDYFCEDQDYPPGFSFVCVP